jgi:hypothetical protein
MKTKARLLFTMAFLSFNVVNAVAQENVVLQWNNDALQSIRYLHTGPTINARALAIMHTCMYDAWAAYDGTAIATVSGSKLRRPMVERTDVNKRTAISYAAYRCLKDLFPAETAKYDVLMNTLGLGLDDGLDPKKPSGVGNLAGASVLEFRHHDGSNQLGDLHSGAYTDYTGYKPVNEPDKITDPDRWQPLRTPVPDGGTYGRFLIQKFLTPQWATVKPFAMSRNLSNSNSIPIGSTAVRPKL